MRFTLALVLLACVATGTPAAGAASSRRWMHTRPVTPGAAILLSDAAHRSMIVRSLLSDLEQTDVIVYLSDAMSGFPGEPQAYLAFVTRTAGARYVLVCIHPTGLSAPERIVLLAHELQHALEVARAPEVQDAAGLAQLYRRIGWESHKHQFESRTARIISSRVWLEQTGQQR